MDQSAESTSGRGRPSKVNRLIDEYDLQGMGAELEQLWTADEDRRSLRDLATHFNQHLLNHALDAADIQQLDGELENTYRLLTDDEVSSTELTRVRRRLEREGIDVDSLQDDFVTYQAIRTYLTKHRDAEYTPSETDPIERQKTNIRKLRGRVISVTENQLKQLRNGDELTIGEFRVLGDIQIVCEDCNTQLDVLELLDRGSCRCSAP
jgi:hypothetical protein